MKFRTRYERFGLNPVVDCFDPSLTKQAMKDECDINKIVARFTKSGVLPDLKDNPMYGDFSDSVSYFDALQLVITAQDQFNGLSADVRARFGNDPAQFLAFAEDPSNQEEMVRLGLATVRDDGGKQDASSSSGDGFGKSKASKRSSSAVSKKGQAAKSGPVPAEGEGPKA